MPVDMSSCVYLVYTYIQIYRDIYREFMRILWYLHPAKRTIKIHIYRYLYSKLLGRAVLAACPHSGSEQLSVRPPPQISSRHPGPIGKTATTAVNNLETSDIDCKLPGVVAGWKKVSRFKEQKNQKTWKWQFQTSSGLSFWPSFRGKEYIKL
jgi:hypothetical protein